MSKSLEVFFHRRITKTFGIEHTAAQSSGKSIAVVVVAVESQTLTCLHRWLAARFSLYLCFYLLQGPRGYHTSHPTLNFSSPGLGCPSLYYPGNLVTWSFSSTLLTSLLVQAACLGPQLLSPLPSLHMVQLIMVTSTLDSPRCACL